MKDGQRFDDGVGFFGHNNDLAACELRMIEHPFGWLSLLPPIVAIGFAVVTKRVMLSLFAGIFVGALVLARWDVLGAIEQTVAEHLWATLIDPDKLHVFSFTMLMGVMVGMINRAAGMRGLVEAVTPLASTRERGQFTTWLLGLFVFFDDYANTMLLGNTLRPLTDKLKISREKLAFLVDSTAAPVAGIALISTWVAGEIGYVSDGLEKLPSELEWKPAELFVASIPYRFYVLWALLFVPMVALLGRDFGPMLKAEKRAAQGELTAGNSRRQEIDPTAPEAETKARWFNAVIPVLVTVGATVWFIYSTGKASTEPAEGVGLRDYFGNGDPYGSLLWGAMAGVLSAVVLIVPQRLISWEQLCKAGGDGAIKMVPALAILWLASALSSMTGNSGKDSEENALTLAQEVAAAVAGSNSEAEPSELRDMVATRLQAQGIGSREAVVAMFELAPQTVSDEAEIGNTQAIAQEFIATPLIEAGYDEGAIAEDIAQVELSLVESELLASKEDSGAASSESEATAVPVSWNYSFAYQDRRLYTGAYLSGLLGDSISPRLMPTIVFILAAVVAFATGTSWGTMGIIMPLVIPLVYGGLTASGVEVGPNHPILLGAIGSVLAGAIFGDHCSPISDTTVLSSQASSCDHVAHVRTQMPYALLVAGVAILCGTLPIGFGVPVWLTSPVGLALLLAVIWRFGKRVA